MRADVARDLGNSAYDFLRVVWPAIAERCGGGRIEPVESTTAQGVAKDLDILAGVDAWQMVDQNGTMRAVASRIQWLEEHEKSWRTFTIRKDRRNGTMTEHERKMRAFVNPEQGWLLPALTVQAYLRKPERSGELVNVGVCYTRELLKFAIENPCVKPRTNRADGVLFDWYGWDAMNAAGYRVAILPRASIRRPSVLDDTQFTSPRTETTPLYEQLSIHLGPK